MCEACGFDIMAQMFFSTALTTLAILQLPHNLISYLLSTEIFSLQILIINWDKPSGS